KFLSLKASVGQTDAHLVKASVALPLKVSAGQANDRSLKKQNANKLQACSTSADMLREQTRA
ncbi:hypothetical protein, partial [Serratia marcescens]|uniref:hypothetical protein n=1 Tax=Serratia marcescens TaxID=615 RepID=UPI00281370A3